MAQILDALNELEADLAEAMATNEAALTDAIIDWALEGQDRMNNSAGHVRVELEREGLSNSHAWRLIDCRTHHA
jgi:hypothetical protein